MYPRDVLYRNNNNINKVVLFSYSGTTNDIITSVKDLDKKKIYIAFSIFSIICLIDLRHSYL